MTTPRFASVILDVDSTVCGVEGIDWLARRRGSEISGAISTLTADAMRGAIPLEEIYGRRLALVRPSRHDIDALSEAYVNAIAPGCEETLDAFRRAEVRVALVSGGIRQALLPLAQRLGVDSAGLRAVDVYFDHTGEYVGFDTASPLTTTTGKGEIVTQLDLPRPVLAVGDGQTDLAMAPFVDAFAAFTGFVAREAVVRRASLVVKSFHDLQTLVFGG